MIRFQISTLLLITCVLLLTTSCKNILKADFESDQPGGVPGSDLHGDPVGDVFDISSFSPSTVHVINSTMGGAHALELSDNNPVQQTGHYGHWVTFNAKQVKLNQLITFNWSGKTIESFRGMSILIDCELSVLPGHQTDSWPVVRLEIDNSNILRAMGEITATGSSSSTQVGNIGEDGTIHKISVSVDIKTMKYSVKLIPSSGQVLPTVSGDIKLPANYINTAANKPSCSFGFGVDATSIAQLSNFQRYVIDDVIIKN